MVYPLITLFPSTATVFDTNGLGSLGEAVSCTVTEERNGSYELEMVYPVTGIHYNDITNRSILYVKPNPVDSPQAFRIYAYTKPMDGLVTYQAEHISYDLAGYPVNAFSASSCAQAMDKLKTNSIVSHNFTFWTDISGTGTVKVETPTSTRSVLGGSDESIVEVFGGEYKFDNFVVRLYNHRGSNRGVVIRYGKNLVDIKQEENMSGVYTAVLPYWYGDVDEFPTLVTLPELTLSVTTDYNFVRVLPLDLTSEFQEKPFVVDLRAKAKDWIAANNPSVPSASFDISFAQLEQTEEYSDLMLLERVDLCDEVTIVYPEFGISATAKVIKTVYDVLTAKYTSVTLGDVKHTISDTIYGQDGSLKDTADSLRSGFRHDLNGLNDAFTDALNNTKTELQKATENATNWITNGKGYMVAVKNETGQWMEICSLDRPDINQAFKVWRWNQGGFGFSQLGYNGPYALAITQDGKINADFITTGNMSAEIIKGGVLKLGGSDTSYGNGHIEMYSYTDDLVGSWDRDNGFYSKGYYYNQLTGAVNMSGGMFTFYDQKSREIAEMKAVNNTDKSTSSWFTITLDPPDSSKCYFGVSYGTISLIGVGHSGNEIDDWISLNMDTIVGGNLDVIGEKHRLVNTKNYGNRTLSSYEMTTPMFGEIGEGVTDEDGQCYVYLNDIFSETVNTKITYQVFLQKQGPGDLWISERNEFYFVVSGTKNLGFSWEIKAKQLDHEYSNIEKLQKSKNEEEIDPGPSYVYLEKGYDKDIENEKESVEKIYDEMVYGEENDI